MRVARRKRIQPNRPKTVAKHPGDRVFMLLPDEIEAIKNHVWRVQQRQLPKQIRLECSGFNAGGSTK